MYLTEIVDRFQSEGVSFLDALIRDRVSEDAALDYKQTQGQDQPGHVSEDDKKNLAEAISAFGNTDGGIVLWGIKCKKATGGVDVPTSKRPIKSVSEFRSKLETLIPGLTSPPHQGVRNFLLTDHIDSGYIATYIPASEFAPIRSLRTNLYYLRSGSSNMIMPHGILSAMFGKRPEPKLSLSFYFPAATVDLGSRSARFGLVMILSNQGETIARNVFLSYKVISRPNSSCKLEIAPKANVHWTTFANVPNVVSHMSPEGFNLPPGAKVHAFSGDFRLTKHFHSPIDLSVTYGSESGRNHRLRFFTSASDLDQIFEEISLEKDYSIGISLNGIGAIERELAKRASIHSRKIFSTDVSVVEEEWAD